MTSNLAAILYLIAGVCFIMALRGPVLARDRAQRQHLRHRRHGDRHRHDPSASRGVEDYLWIGVGIVVGGTDRHGDRAPHPHDRDAAARGGLPQPGGAGRGARRRRRALCTGDLPHRHARRHQAGEPHRDELRRGDRRTHLHRLGRRLRQAAGADDRRAAGSSAASTCSTSRSSSRSWPSARVFSVEQQESVFWAMTGLALIFGVLLIVPIGGADMPGGDLDVELVLGMGGRRASASPSRTRCSSLWARWWARPARF